MRGASKGCSRILLALGEDDYELSSSQQALSDHEQQLAAVLGWSELMKDDEHKVYA